MYSSASTAVDVERFRVVAEATSDVYHDFAELLDDSDRILTGATDRDFDDYADYYVAWARSEDQVLGRNTVMEPYFARFQDQSADVATNLAAFNAYCAGERDDGDDDFEDFVELDAAGWVTMGQAIELELNKIHQRQLDMAGTLARAIWFDAARRVYVPSSRRHTSNFIINTFDMSDMVEHNEWIGMSEAARSPGNVLPADRVFHTTLVNEVQIELGSEEAYLDRIDELSALVDAGTRDGGRRGRPRGRALGVPAVPRCARRAGGASRRPHPALPPPRRHRRRRVGAGHVLQGSDRPVDPRRRGLSSEAHKPIAASIAATSIPGLIPSVPIAANGLAGDRA